MTMQTRVATCTRCGLDREVPIRRGPAPRLCPDCGGVRVPRPRRPRGPNNLAADRPPAYRLALAVTDYRLAIEEATTALRMGRAQVALAALERVEAPARTQ